VITPLTSRDILFLLEILEAHILHNLPPVTSEQVGRIRSADLERLRAQLGALWNPDLSQIFVILPTPFHASLLPPDPGWSDR
jgi:hypothetical protein